MSSYSDVSYLRTRVSGRVVCVLAAIIFVSFGCQPATAQGTVVIGAKMVNGLTEANGAISTLIALRQASSDALAGHPPSSGGDFVKLADQYKKAAADVSAAPLPTTLIPTANTVSVAALTNCATRQNAITKLNNFLGDLLTTQQKGQVSLSQLDDEQTHIAKAEEALTFLTSSFQKLSQIPVFGDQFALHWLDLQGVVSHPSPISVAP